MKVIQDIINYFNLYVNVKISCMLKGYAQMVDWSELAPMGKRGFTVMKTCYG